jgi:hypothetical protein
MTEERKQEQQREVAEAFLKAQWRFEWPRLSIDAILGLTETYAEQQEKIEEIKLALCSPYGRFFNEGTD